MIFRQLFDSTSGTYSYLLASRWGGEALIIDPVIEKVDRYLQLVHELDLKLVKAIDTHLHADHITGLGAECMMPQYLDIAEVVDHRVDDQRLAAPPTGKQITVGAGCTVEQLTEYHGLPRVSAVSP